MNRNPQNAIMDNMDERHEILEVMQEHRKTTPVLLAFRWSDLFSYHFWRKPREFQLNRAFEQGRRDDPLRSRLMAYPLHKLRMAERDLILILEKRKRQSFRALSPFDLLYLRSVIRIKEVMEAQEKQQAEEHRKSMRDAHIAAVDNLRKEESRFRKWPQEMN